MILNLRILKKENIKTRFQPYLLEILPKKLLIKKTASQKEAILLKDISDQQSSR